MIPHHVVAHNVRLTSIQNHLCGLAGCDTYGQGTYNYYTLRLSPLCSVLSDCNVTDELTRVNG